MTDAVATPASTTGEFDVGATLPPFIRAAGPHTWNRYAAVNDEFVGIHMDDAEGQAAGYPGAIGMGNLVWAWMHCAVEQWLGDRGRLEHIECRFKAPTLKGDQVTCTGTVTDCGTDDDGSTVLDLELWAEDQTGNRFAGGRGRVRLTPAG
jgi:acyl dehydratase